MRAASAAERVAAEVARAARRPRAARALILDLDGTLAPIARTPDAARVPGPVLRSLHDLVDRGWRIAIVTGRPRREALTLVPVPRITVFGSHGLEGAHRTLPRAARAVRARLARLARAAAREASRFPGVRLERKPVGLAFHDRALAPAARRRWRRRVAAWLSGCDLDGLEVLRGKCVIELRPARLGKERVLRAWRPARARAGDRSLVAVGDDGTDEDLFAALGPSGLPVRVGPPRARTAARRRLPSARAVAEFLSVLADRSAAGDADER